MPTDPSLPPRAQAALADAATARAALAEGEAPAALAAWARVREGLRARPRLGSLGAVHLEAHRLPLAIAGAAPLARGAAERIYEDGVALARELGRGLEVARLELAFAGYQQLRGPFQAARVHAQRARDVGDRLGAPALAARGAAACAAAELAQGLPVETGPLRARLAALETGGEAEAALARAALWRRLAWAEAARGDLDVARAHAAQAVAAAEKSEAEARARAETGWLDTLAGRHGSATEQVRRALETLPRPDAEGARLAALGVEALTALETGALARARESAVEAADLAARWDVREDPWLPLPWIAAECLAAAGEADAARARLAQAARRRGPRDTCAQRLHEARALHRLGDDTAARQARARAAALREADPLGRVLWRATGLAVVR